MVADVHALGFGVTKNHCPTTLEFGRLDGFFDAERLDGQAFGFPRLTFQMIRSLRPENVQENGRGGLWPPFAGPALLDQPDYLALNLVEGSVDRTSWI